MQLFNRAPFTGSCQRTRVCPGAIAPRSSPGGVDGRRRLFNRDADEGEGEAGRRSRRPNRRADLDDDETFEQSDDGRQQQDDGQRARQRGWSRASSLEAGESQDAGSQEGRNTWRRGRSDEYKTGGQRSSTRGGRSLGNSDRGSWQQSERGAGRGEGRSGSWSGRDQVQSRERHADDQEYTERGDGYGRGPRQGGDGWFDRRGADRQRGPPRQSRDSDAEGRAEGGRSWEEARVGRGYLGSSPTSRQQEDAVDEGEAGPGAVQQGGPGSSEAGSPPVKKVPSVKLRLDLPVVRENDKDKGTFYAPDARWDELGLTADVVEALRSLGFKKPSHVQAATLKAWRSVETQHLAIADQAGSGKTLAYLLPLIQTIRSQDATAGKPVTMPKSPRAIIVTPTVELVQQVYRVAKALSNAGARLRVAAMTGGQADERERQRSQRTQREQLAQGVDLVIATPGRLVEHIKSGHMDLAACRGLVLDEVDVLLGDTTAFDEQMAPLREAAPDNLRFVLVTATLPQHTAESLQQSFKDIKLISGPGLHRTPAGLVEELIDCSGGEDISLESGVARKIDALHRVLRQHGASRTLVFCNKIESCREVENALRRKYDPARMQVLVYHEAIREDLRQAAMNAFLAPVGQEGEALAHLQQFSGRRRSNRGAAGLQGDDAELQEEPEQPEEQYEGPPQLVMVATDRMSRGIDCMYCQHVVLFDFPRDPSEYVRRVGRTARGAGGQGVVSSLVLGRQVPLAREIVSRNEKGQPVHRLPRNF